MPRELLSDCDCNDFPPEMSEHLNGSAPKIYYWFWAISGICSLIVFFIQIPHLTNIRIHADRQRKEHKRVFVPRAHTYIFYLNLMPILFVVFDFVILLNPSAVYTMFFAVHCYEAFAFLIFKKLITLYLGGPENALQLMSTYPPKKIWAAFPLCCCWIFCYPCIPHTHLTPRTFRRIYNGVYQFAFLMPVIAFIEVIRGYSGSSHEELFEKILSAIRITSVIICIYALIVYMKAASEPLEEYRTKGKFWAMKITIVAASFVYSILSYIPIPTPKGSEYDDYDREVMTAAWSSVCTIVLMVPLAWVLRRVFTISDCDLSRPIFMSEDLTTGAASLYGTIETNRKESEIVPIGKKSITIRRDHDDD